MKVVSTFHQPSSVNSSVKCCLDSRDTEQLVIAKLNRVDVYTLKPQGLEHECGIDVWGAVASVKAIPISADGMRSNLVLLTSHPDPELIFLSYVVKQDGSATLEASKHLSLYERAPRRAEFTNDIVIHDSGNLAVMSSYAGKLKVIRLEAGKYESDFDVSIPENNLLSFTFIPDPDEYAVALLYLDSEEKLHIYARDIDVEGLEMPLSTLFQSTAIMNKVIPSPTETTPLLVPVPPEESSSGGEDSLGGVLVVGGRQILFFQVLDSQGQEKQKGKQKRLENKKKAADAAEVAQAKAKEKEREGRKRRAKASVEWPWSNVSAWCPIDGAPRRYLIGDIFGRLAMLSVENVDDFGMILIPLGETSPAQTMSYLTNQNLYVGSHLGDSQLLQISPTPISKPEFHFPSENPLRIPSEIRLTKASTLALASSRKGKGRVTDDMDVDEEDFRKGRVVEPQGSHINVLESFKNIAPIHDAILVDLDGSGEKQIVTCSGGGNTGSVNLIRNGADFKELALVPGMVDATSIWSARTMRKDTDDSRLIVSAVNATYLFQVNDRGPNTTLSRVVSSHIGGLEVKQSTLAFSNLYRRSNGTYQDSSLVVQVVPKGPILLEWDSALAVYQHKFRWPLPDSGRADRPAEVVAASANGTQVALGLAGGRMIVLCIDEGQDALREVDSYRTERVNEISAISCVPLDPQAYASKLVVLAYWKIDVIEILRITQNGLKLDATSEPLPSLVRSVLLYNFGIDGSQGPNYHPYLLAGLADGSVAIMHYREKEKDKSKKLTDLKIISLGHAPVNLVPCNVGGRRTVFAAGSRSTILYLEKNRVANSPIMLKDISAATSFDTPSFRSALALATPKGLFIGRVNEMNKLHIRSVSLGLDSPRRIIHEPSLKVYGVTCMRMEPMRVGGFDPIRSSFQLLDDNSLARLGQYNSSPDEDITSVVAFSVDVESQRKPFFCIGTFKWTQAEYLPSSGKLHILAGYTGTSDSRNPTVELSVLTSTEVKGCVYALKYVDNKIVAAVNSSVILFSLDINSESSTTPIYTLKKVAEWNHNYIVTQLGTFEDRVFVGDQINSVSLLKVNSNGLEVKGRNYGPLNPISVEGLGAQNLICGNDTLNIYTMRLGQILGRSALEIDGCYHLGDMVSVFVRGSLTSTESSTQESKLNPELVFFTGSGRIGVIVDVVDNDLSLHLTELQRNLGNVIKGVGGTSHARFRAPRNRQGVSDADSAAFGFLDGDFIEQFSTVLGSPDRLNKVINGNNAPEALSLTTGEVLRIIETLQSLH